MKIEHAIPATFALMQPLAGAKAITFTANTTIAAGDLTYDGQPVVASNSTLTVNGPHSYASLSVVSNGVVTHSSAPAGETNNRVNLAIAGDVWVEGSSAINAAGCGYPPRSGPGAGANAWSGTGSGGGGHGGRGGAGSGGSAGGAVNDSLAVPGIHGSGGGERINDSDGAGSAGGGVYLTTGTLRQAVASVDVAFNQAVRSETFTPEDVLITAPSGRTPSGDITVTPLSAASFRIAFGSQAAVGTYLVQIGPHIENLLGQEMAAAYVGTFTITNPVVSGFVKRADGAALVNVLLSAGGALSTRTGTNGAFALAVPPGWSGTVTPTNGGWVFAPASLSYANLTADATNQNFTANLAEAIVLTTTRSGGALNFRWPSAGGLSYQLQSATNLPATIWFNEGPPFPGTGGTVGTNLSLGPEPKRFFRLQIEN